MSSSNLMRCTACCGKKEIMGAGMIFHKCKTCAGIGYVEDTENNAEQDSVENPKDAKAETNVDTCAPDCSQAEREQIGESTVGSGESHLSERKNSGKSRKKSGRNQSEEESSGQSLQEN